MLRSEFSNNPKLIAISSLVSLKLNKELLLLTVIYAKSFYKCELHSFDKHNQSMLERWWVTCKLIQTRSSYLQWLQNYLVSIKWNNKNLSQNGRSLRRLRVWTQRGKNREWYGIKNKKTGYLDGATNLKSSDNKIKNGWLSKNRGTPPSQETMTLFWGKRRTNK